MTLLATTDKFGNSLPTFDGSTWDPWAQRLLFTFEAGNNGGVWQATLDFPPTVEDISGVIGRADSPPARRCRISAQFTDLSGIASLRAFGSLTVYPQLSVANYSENYQ